MDIVAVAAALKSLSYSLGNSPNFNLGAHSQSAQLWSGESCFHS